VCQIDTASRSPGEDEISLGRELPAPLDDWLSSSMTQSTAIIVPMTFLSARRIADEPKSVFPLVDVFARGTYGDELLRVKASKTAFELSRSGI
jgi:hypothetical protein